MFKEIYNQIRDAIAVVLLRLAIRIGSGNLSYRFHEGGHIHSMAWDWAHDVEPQNQLRVARKRLREIAYKSDDLNYFICDTLQIYERHEKNFFKNFLLMFKGIFVKRLFLQSNANAFRNRWGDTDNEE